MSATSVLSDQDILSSLDFKPQCGIFWVNNRDPNKRKRCTATAEFFAVFINARDAEDTGLSCPDCVAQMRHQDVLLRAEPLK